MANKIMVLVRLTLVQINIVLGSEIQEGKIWETAS